MLAIDYLIVKSSEMFDISEMTIGSQLRQMRHASGFTQVELAEQSGIAQGTISRIERGDYKEIPPPDVLNPLGKALGTTAAPLLDAAGFTLDSSMLPEIDPSDPRELLAARIRRIQLREDDLAILNRNLDVWEARNKKEREERKA